MSISEDKRPHTVMITTDSSEVISFASSRLNELIVSDGDRVIRGQRLTGVT